MIPADPEVGSWASRCEVDPLQVPVSDKGDLLTAATAEMRAQGADIATGLYRIWDTRKWFVSSEGHRVDQRIRECGGGISATAVGERETQVRSHPSRRGQYGTRGWELVTELDLAAHASRIADEAQALLRAPQCPSGQTFTTCVVVFSKGRRAGHAGGRAPGCRRRSRPLHHRGASVGTG